MPVRTTTIEQGRHPMTRMIWEPVESHHRFAGSQRLQGRRVLVLGGDPGTADSVAAALSGGGAVVCRIEPQIAPHRVADHIADFGRVDAIVDLNVGAPFAINDTTAWEQPLLQTVRALQSCYDAWVMEADAERIGYVAVTRMGGHMGYRDTGCIQPLGGLWAGLAKTLPQELPNCNTRIVDLSERDYANAGEIVSRELYDWGLFEIGWIDGVRYELRPRVAPASANLPDLDDRDTVLLSGGARGIGFRLASYVARECGCRVIITGRHAAPDPSAEWAQMDDEEFRRYEWATLRHAARAGELATARHRLQSEKNARELLHNLSELGKQRLRVEYRQCDVTSAVDVAALVRSLASSLTVVVHNAGVDLPVRLPSKSANAVLQTVRTKVNGFVNLLSAVEDIPLRLFCNVGSLTGRWGGMTGETDYAAANEGLSRLGMWANGRFGFPIKTICWPTWDRVGMIKNFDVTNEYMSPLDVEEGLSHWHRELRSSQPAEVTYVGVFGGALAPVQLNGFPGGPGIPNIGDLETRRHYLGRVVTFRPFQQMRCHGEIDARVAPLLHDFTVDGETATPVSVLLEYALEGADWIQPAGRTRLHVHEVRNVDVGMRGLRCTGGKYVFTRDVSGSGTTSEWIVSVSITVDGESVLRAEVVYRPDSPAERTLERIPHGAAASMGNECALRWGGHLFPVGVWIRAGHLWATEVRPCESADLWATVTVPFVRLPVAHLENAILAAARLENAQAPRDRLHIGSIRCYASVGSRYIVGDTTAGVWRILDADGGVGLEIERLTFDVAKERTREVDGDRRASAR